MKIVYHLSDLDGKCCAALAHKFFPNAGLIPHNYHMDFPWDQIERGEAVWMLDISLPMEDMSRLQTLCWPDKLTWIDHHKSAMLDAEDALFDAFGLRRTDAAGCELLWEYVMGANAEIPIGVRLLGRYDIWDHKDQRVLPFQYGVRGVKEAQNPLDPWWLNLFSTEKLCLDYIEQIRKTGVSILNYVEAQNELLSESTAFESVLTVGDKSYRALVMNRPLANSQMFTSWDPTQHDIMLAFHRTTNKCWSVSLYTTKTKEIDCGAICKNFGGGGHPGAAGFHCTTLPFDH